MIKKILLCGCLSFTILQNTWADDNHQLDPQLKASLGTKVLTEKEVYAGADRTNIIYFTCIRDTAVKLKMMYPEFDQDTVIETINDICISAEDRYSIYSILLASTIAMKKPLSEKQAAAYLEKSYAEMGRDKAQAEQRQQIYKKIGLIK